MKMSEARYEEVYKYVISMSMVMNLSHFHSQVRPDYETKENVLAATEVSAEGIGMIMSIAQIFFSESPEVQRHTICHELLHGPMEPLFQSGFNSGVMQDQVATTTFSLLHEQGRSLLERTIDQLSYGWANLLPLPSPFPK